MRPFPCARLALGLLLLSAPTFSQTALEDAHLIGLDTAPFDYFGGDVSLSGGRALIGAQHDDDDGSQSGSAYVFEHQGDGSWVQVAKLTASDGEEEDIFGSSVSLSGERALVGAHFQGPSSPSTEGPGAAYVFERQANGSWLEVAKLTASDGVEGDSFGSSVSLSGDRALCAAFRDDDLGSAYVFERQAGGSWVEVAKLTASDPQVGDDFGMNVSLAGDRALVGASFESEEVPFAGAAYVFERQLDGSWLETAKLKASDPRQFDSFGFAVRLSGDIALVGAPGSDTGAGPLVGLPGVDDDTGAVYVFERQVDGSWAEVAKLKARDAEEGAYFGYGVSSSGHRALIGALHVFAPTGSAYLFERRGDGSWTEDVKLESGDGAGSFGRHVALSGDHALAGAPFHTTGAPFHPAYIFDLGALYHGAREVSVAQGGSQDLLLRAGSEHAGETFVLLGSLSGTSPGLTDPLSGLVLPLNPDAYFLWLLKKDGGGLVSPLVGALDGEGSAAAAFALPSGSPPSFVGLTLHHAYVALDVPGKGAATLASNAVKVELVP